jgi:DNA helicase-2/ATP-dependent DNA helicase PcrA
VFMQDIALLTNDDADKNPDADTVSMMTIHSSKGLEFSQVYIVGLEENLFPSQMSLNSRSDLEEERRLFYVAVTRAEKRLTLTYSTSRYRWGSLNNCEPSRFLDELDPAYLDLEFKAKSAPTEFKGSFDQERGAWRREYGNSVGGGAGFGDRKETESFSKPKPRPKTTSILPKAHQPTPGFMPSDTKNIQVGMEVEHERFGFGKVISLEGTYPEIKATIFFKELGQKQLLLKFAKLRIID